MAQFRITWRHEVIIEAKAAAEARQIWEHIDIGSLNKELVDGDILHHEYIELVSFEDEEYNDIED